MREFFEQQEVETLSPLAIKSIHSKGRRFEEPPSGDRTCFQRDRDRIIHSKAFRRLKHKTQVFIATESDHFRSRLTHSIEVAQISRHLSRMLRLNEDVCEAIALAHDLGHTPFGHAGERTLNTLMESHGGFEHNLHSLRIVDILESKYPQFPGLNLSFEIRAGLMKHKSPYDDPGMTLDFNSLEAEVVNLADEISYNNHDLDDGLSSGILTDSDLEKKVTLWREAKAHIREEYSNLEDHELKYLINSYLISSQIRNVVDTTKAKIEELDLNTIDDLQKIKKDVVSFDSTMKEEAKELRKTLFTQFYTHHEVYRMNKKGQLVIEDLFKAFQSDPKLLPQVYRERIKNEPKERVISDYIAGMTDTFAIKEYEALFQ
ncbi:deoxyguanosinetriphosphate triphosphohydrolase [bacterium]|nr:deoxyguanosinetriphosphate triphosphohydrolase [bacterium]